MQTVLSKKSIKSKRSNTQNIHTAQLKQVNRLCPLATGDIEFIERLELAHQAAYTGRQAIEAVRVHRVAKTVRDISNVIGGNSVRVATFPRYRRSRELVYWRLLFIFH